MNIQCLNYQRLGIPLTVQALRALVAQERLDVMFLMEINREVVLQKFEKVAIISKLLCGESCRNWWGFDFNVEWFYIIVSELDLK